MIKSAIADLFEVRNFPNPYEILDAAAEISSQNRHRGGKSARQRPITSGERQTLMRIRHRLVTAILGDF